MSFQAYLDNIEAKTGVSPNEFMKRAKTNGLLSADTKAMQIVNWLKEDYDLGHGHAMALVKYFKDNAEKWINRKYYS